MSSSHAIPLATWQVVSGGRVEWGELEGDGYPGVDGLEGVLVGS